MASEKSGPFCANKCTDMSAGLAHLRFSLTLFALLAACLLAGDLWGSGSPAMEGIDGHLWSCDFIPIKQGGAYVYGTFTDNLRFGDQTLTAYNEVGGYLARMDTSGRWLWARQFEGCTPLSLMDSGLRVAELPDGNLNLAAFHLPEPRSGQIAGHREGEMAITLSTITPSGDVTLSKTLMGALQIMDWSLDYFPSGELLLVAKVKGYWSAADPAQADKDGVYIGKFSTGGDFIWANLITFDSRTIDDVNLFSFWPPQKMSSAGNVFITYSVTKHLENDDTQRTEYLIALNAAGKEIFSVYSLNELAYVSDDGQYIVYEEAPLPYPRTETSQKTLYKMDMQGKLVDSWRSPIEDRDYWGGDITDEDGNLYSHAGETISCKGPDGSSIWELEILSDGYPEISGLIRTSRGNLVIYGEYSVEARFGSLKPLNKSSDEFDHMPFVAMITDDGYWAWAVDVPQHPVDDGHDRRQSRILDLGNGHVLYSYDDTAVDRSTSDTGYNYCRMVVYDEAGNVTNDTVLGSLAGVYGGTNGLIGDGRGGFIFYQAGYAQGFFDKSGTFIQSEHPQLVKLDSNGNVTAQAILPVCVDSELISLELLENGNVLLVQAKREFRSAQFHLMYWNEGGGGQKYLLGCYTRDLAEVWEREVSGMSNLDVRVDGNKIFCGGYHEEKVSFDGRAITRENDDGHLEMEINSSGSLVSDSVTPRTSQQGEGYDLYHCGEWSDYLGTWSRETLLGQGNYYVAGGNPKDKKTWIHRFDYDGTAEMISDEAGNVYLTGLLNNEWISIGEFSVSDYSGTDHIYLAIFGPDGQCAKLKKIDYPNSTRNKVTLAIDEFIMFNRVVYIAARKGPDTDIYLFDQGSITNTELLIIAYDVENAQTKSNIIEPIKHNEPYHTAHNFDYAGCTVLPDGLGGVYLAEYIPVDIRYGIEVGNLIRLDRSLYEVWRKEIFVDSIVTDNRGNVLVLGNIDDSTKTEVDGHVLLGYGQYLAKINPEGVVEWAYRCEDFPLQGHGGASMPAPGNGR